MSRGSPGTDEHRVLLLASTTKDAHLCRSVLDRAGMSCFPCADLKELCRELEKGAGAVLLAEEAVGPNGNGSLTEWLDRQLTWSDVPVLILARHGADSAVVGQAMDLLGNVTVLERPIRVAALVSSVRTALRARQRQYQIRDHLDQRERASERLRLLWEATTILLTAEDPDTMLQGLFRKIGKHLGVDSYFNFMVTEAGDALRLASCSGITEEQMSRMARLEFGQSICGTVAVKRRPMVAARVQQGQDPKTQLIRSFGIRACACNPLLAGDRLLGTLSFASRSRDDFTSHELEFLEIICRYVTAAYERLRLIKRLQEADRRKDEFLAVLAHELRNPLAPIRNSIHILQLTSNHDPTADRVHETMERQVNHMVRLVDDLLEVSRITRGKIELRKEPVELASVVRNAVETSMPLIEAAGHRFVIDIPPDPLTMLGDPVRLSQILANLLNNAAKYTDPGGQIWLTVRQEEGSAVLSVRDTGTGIQRDMLPRVFELFAQVERHAARAQGGLGIGLTLVKALVEMHGGTVTADSEGPGRGSEFVVRLPLAAVSRRPDIPAAPPVALAPRRVLIVDDNRDAAESLAMLLKVLGAQVSVAFSGADALDVLETFQPGVIMLDIGMPDMDGHEVARRIRLRPEFQHVTLIALTGWGQEEDRRRSHLAGFDYHLIKPADIAALQKVVSMNGDDAARLAHDRLVRDTRPPETPAERIENR